MEWRPIESAPKDGRAILGYADGEMATVQWVKITDFKCRFYLGYWTLVVSGAYAEDGEWWPTHWMELPEAPVG